MALSIAAASPLPLSWAVQMSYEKNISLAYIDTLIYMILFKCMAIIYRHIYLKRTTSMKPKSVSVLFRCCAVLPLPVFISFAHSHSTSCCCSTRCCCFFCQWIFHFSFVVLRANIIPSGGHRSCLTVSDQARQFSGLTQCCINACWCIVSICFGFVCEFIWCALRMQVV